MPHSTHGLTPHLDARDSEDVVRDRRAFAVRKLHSLTGVLPLGVFLVLHLWSNASALQGAERFAETYTRLHQTPGWWVLEVVFIALPLLFHGGLGVWLALRTRSSVHRYPTAGTWNHLLQRITGLVTLAFIILHLGHVRIPLLRGEILDEDVFQRLCSSLSATTTPGIPLLAMAYLLGVSAAVYHFANGLGTFFASWGISQTRVAHRRATLVFGCAGVALLLLGASVIVYFATGSRYLLVLQPPGDQSPLSCRDAAKPEKPATLPAPEATKP